MRKLILVASAAALTLTACSDRSGESMAEYDLAASEPEAASEAGTDASGEIPVSVPQIAYSYQFGYRLPATEIPAVQQAHVALCEQRGLETCRVLNMSNSGGEGDYATGRLHLEVAAAQAAAFGEQLADALDNSGGSQISSSIAGEDLSKQIVDTEARLRSRVLLSQRLTELLATRKGTVAELVEAERAVTQVNEEIDRARSWLAEMRGRVAFSKIEISYQSGAPGSGGFSKPIREALGGIASALGNSVASLIMFTALLLPWLLVLALAIYLRRRFKSDDRTFWGRKKHVTEDKED
ncbi:MAG: DUF4349 domain-containing protein [Pseudomonadota bacterium]